MEKVELKKIPEWARNWMLSYPAKKLLRLPNHKIRETNKKKSSFRDTMYNL